MNFIDKIKQSFAKKVLTYANSFKNYSPTFTQFGDRVMEDETVQQIVSKIINEYTKLSPRHIRMVEGRHCKVADENINNLLKRPNSLMTQSDFLSKIAYLREAYNNAWIYPTYDLYVNKHTGQRKKVWTGFYPLQPQRYEIMQDRSGTYYVRFYFNNQTEPVILLFDEVILWRKDYWENDFVGGGAVSGLPNNTALLRHLQLNHKLTESTFKVVESSLSINGVLKYGGLVNEADREKARLRFTEQLKNNESGIIATDVGAEYVPITNNGKFIDKDILDFLDSKTRRHWGVSKAILEGDYTNEQKEAFYEGVMEAGVISLGQAFSRVLFTPMEQSYGNSVIFYPNRIQLMSLDKQMQFAQLLAPMGGITVDEIREFGGLPPMPNGTGCEPMMSLNWIKKSIADQYQLDRLYGKTVVGAVGVEGFSDGTLDDAGVIKDADEDEEEEELHKEHEIETGKTKGKQNKTDKKNPDTETDLYSMTSWELKLLAKEQGIKGYGSMSKEELIASLGG